MRARLLLSITSFAALVLAVALPVRALDDDRILRNFAIVAFGAEFGQSNTRGLAKWTRPVRVFTQIDTAMPSSEEDYLERHMARLARLTGLDIEFVSRKEEANFVVAFVPRRNFLQAVLDHYDRARATPKFARELARSHCVGIYTTKGSTGEIVRAVAIIPADYALERGLLRMCIVEETTQAMGLPNDSDRVHPSIFNDSNNIKDLTAHDRLLIRLLYHRDMKPGMSKTAALRAARELIPDLRASN